MVFILPSYYEGHPKVLLEAMSCGLPCIGTNVRGIREDVEHMKTGYLCETDHNSIADGLFELTDYTPFDETIEDEMTHTWWMVRREIAWAAGVADNFLPPV